jgi:hypothetical protein
VLETTDSNKDTIAYAPVRFNVSGSVDVVSPAMAKGV